MLTATTERPVARKKADQGPLPVSVKIPFDVVETARIVAAFRAESMTEMLGDILRPVLAKMERDETAKRAKKAGQ